MELVVAFAVNFSPANAAPNSFLTIIRPSPNAVTFPFPSTSRLKVEGLRIVELDKKS